MSGFAGTLGERVTIEARGPERDATGGALGAWSAIATVWAGVTPDGIDPAEGRARPRWRVAMRERAVSVEERLVWRGRVLAIDGVARDPRTPDRMTLTATEQA